MTETTPNIIPLRDAKDYPREVVGGKARELGELLASGFAVPDGFVIPTGVAARYAAADQLPAELIEALKAVRPRAFRSSAVSEDGVEASFAGQYESVLSVTGLEPSIEALRTCWAAAHGEALDEYVHSVSHRNGGLAVIVQDMVAADCAGVAFTRNPITGADEVLIEATRGLGDQLLEGCVEPERWVVRSETPQRESGPDAVLAADQVGEILRVCRAIETERGGPQDVEWAFAGGALYVLQARPVTALPIEPTERPPAGQCWERDDGHFPEPVVPFAATFWLPMHRRCIADVAERGGLPMRSVHTEVYGGRVYARIEPLIDPGNDEGSPPPRLAMWLVLRLVPAFRKRVKAAAAAVEADLPMALIDAWEGGGRERGIARTRELLDLDRSAMDDLGLAEHIEECARHCEELGIIHFEFLLLTGLSTLGELGRLMERHLGWDAAQTVDLVQGFGASSTAAGRALDDLAEALGEDAEAVRVLHETPAELRSLDSPGGEAFRRFLDESGHRLFSMAIDRPSWAEDPAPLIELLRARLDGEVARVDPRSIAHAAEARAREAIEPAEWPRAERAIQRARRARPYQDETEDRLSEAFVVLRYATREAGDRLTDRGIVTDPASVWFLQYEEVLAGLRGQPVEADIARRKGEYRWAHGNRLPAVLGPAPQPPPQMTFPKKVHSFLSGIFWALSAEGQREVKPLPGADFSGLGCSPGEARGRVRIIRTPEQLHELRSGEILVCHGTTAAWSVAFPLVAGVITETGGPLSHPATLAREYGIPGVLCVANATAELKNGDLVRIDGVTGAVWRESAE